MKTDCVHVLRKIKLTYFKKYYVYVITIIQSFALHLKLASNSLAGIVLPTGPKIHKSVYISFEYWHCVAVTKYNSSTLPALLHWQVKYNAVH